MVICSSQAAEKKVIHIDSLVPELTKDVVKISRTWELPPVLGQISGFGFLDSARVACIQDEIGSIFIFNLNSGVIEEEIPFGPPGDYEAIALVKEDAYVACADGRLFEILNFRSEPLIKEYGTHLTVKQKMAGLCYDPKNKRLLVAIRGKEFENELSKGIYAFDLVTKKMPVKPVIKIDLLDTVFGVVNRRRANMVIQPSDISINPVTNAIYLTDATRPQILQMTGSGKITKRYQLNRVDFFSTEGISFSDGGGMYITSEGNKHQPGKLMLVELQ